MAHFAQLDDNDIVIKVIVVNNDCVSNKLGIEDEEIGIAFCQSLLGGNTRWAQTSYNGNFRKRYAGQGYTYDAQNDVFIAPQPFPSWVLDNETFDWVPPVARPTDGMYVWNEETLTWDAVPMPE